MTNVPRITATLTFALNSMRKDVMSLSVGRGPVEPTPGHYRVLRAESQLRAPFTLPFSPDTTRGQSAHELGIHL